METIYIQGKGDPEVGLWGVAGTIDIDLNLELSADDKSQIKEFFRELCDIEKSEIHTSDEYAKVLEAEREMELNSLEVYLEGLTKAELIKIAIENITR